MPDVQSFPQGFIQGWRFIMGERADVPEIPRPELIDGKTAYQSGLAKGLEVGLDTKQAVATQHH